MKGQTVIKELFTVPELGPKATGLDQWSQMFFLTIHLGGRRRRIGEEAQGLRSTNW